MTRCRGSRYVCAKRCGYFVDGRKEASAERQRGTCHHRWWRPFLGYIAASPRSYCSSPKLRPLPLQKEYLVVLVSLSFQDHDTSGIFQSEEHLIVVNQFGQPAIKGGARGLAT